MSQRARVQACSSSPPLQEPRPPGRGSTCVGARRPQQPGHASWLAVNSPTVSPSSGGCLGGRGAQHCRASQCWRGCFKEDLELEATPALPASPAPPAQPRPSGWRRPTVACCASPRLHQEARAGPADSPRRQTLGFVQNASPPAGHPLTHLNMPGSAGPGDRPDLLRGSLSSPHRPSPHDSLLSTASHVINKDGEEAKAKYNGDFVHVKYFHVHAGGNFEVKNRTMTLLKQMRDLRHENINGFLGMLCDPVRPGLVMEYCSRKSLEDVIRQEDIKLDWSFRLSLLTDLVRGMRYLHGSLLRHHGRLTSRNCVIDARWVLKVTDYGLPGIYEYQNLSQPTRPLRDLLWKAPELLRDESLMAKGTQAGDVFSLAIIMQEVVVRGAPYCMVQLSHQEIIARLKKPPPMIRPSVSKGAAPPDAINVMKQCWAELPEMRPDFNQINDLFKKLNQGRRQNIVDTMFQMLEKYSSNLEELIKDRTEQLDLEKKKTEQLLNRMLPSSVANQLKLGMPVAPEEFEEVTIYFSDIVGFTSISAYSTPFEVVDLLNDLYTAFDSTINHYNVYKVETIGDAYMVVGGAPKKIDDHASQIATMALDLLHLSGKFRIRHLHNIPLMLRIGIHSGPCCAGVVGNDHASLLPLRGHCQHRLQNGINRFRVAHSQYRGLTKLKGKGEMNTYWLLGKEGFNKELPVPPEIGYSHGLDEELVRQGRQHYMNRRDSAVESLTTARGFSSIQAARLQSLADDAADGTSHSACEGIAGALQEDGRGMCGRGCRIGEGPRGGIPGPLWCWAAQRPGAGGGRRGHRVRS
ncbi:hypothetical protein O3P69_003555 [Scylla paramamosain]|uniref:guanylate cyclase n=1 Tax=Scylla paramamosain TaxID=85552 RepID=A0AAW0UHG1_SCYPA